MAISGFYDVYRGFTLTILFAVYAKQESGAVARIPRDTAAVSFDIYYISVKLCYSHTYATGRSVHSVKRKIWSYHAPFRRYCKSSAKNIHPAPIPISNDNLEMLLLDLIADVGATRSEDLR